MLFICVSSDTRSQTNANPILCINPDTYILQGAYRVFWVLLCFSFVRRNLKSLRNVDVKKRCLLSVTFSLCRQTLQGGLVYHTERWELKRTFSRVETWASHTNILFYNVLDLRYPPRFDRIQSRLPEDHPCSVSPSTVPVPYPDIFPIFPFEVRVILHMTQTDTSYWWIPSRLVSHS